MYFVCLVAGIFIGLAAVALRSAMRIEKLERKQAETTSMLLAAEWLARYNYSYYAAMQDVMLRELDSNYHTLQGKMLRQLGSSKEYGFMGQMIPLDRVPSSLREAAQRYNRRVQEHWPLPYVQILNERGESEARTQQLQDAVASMQMQDDKPFDEELLRRVAARSGVSVAVVEMCLLELQRYARNRADHILGIQDPEEVLPSIY